MRVLYQLVGLTVLEHYYSNVMDDFFKQFSGGKGFRTRNSLLDLGDHTVLISKKLVPYGD